MGAFPTCIYIIIKVFLFLFLASFFYFIKYRILSISARSKTIPPPPPSRYLPYHQTSSRPDPKPLLPAPLKFPAPFILPFIFSHPSIHIHPHPSLHPTTLPHPTTPNRSIQSPEFNLHNPPPPPLPLFLPPSLPPSHNPTLLTSLDRIHPYFDCHHFFSSSFRAFPLQLPERIPKAKKNHKTNLVNQKNDKSSVRASAQSHVCACQFRR